MSTLDKTWITANRTSEAYIAGLNKFLDFAFKTDSQKQIVCPCKKCLNRYWEAKGTVRDHCIINGFWTTYVVWDRHGEPWLNPDHNSDEGETVHVHQEDDPENDPEADMINFLNDAFGRRENQEEPNPECAAFTNMLNDANEMLYPGCPRSKLSVIVKLLHMKVFHRMTNRALDAILSLLREIIPAAKDNIPESHYDAKKYIAGLGLEYQKIDACPKDCVLYRGQYSELTACPVCNSCRYIQPTGDGVDEDADKRRKKVPQKVLRYFPPIKRLQRLYSSEKTAKYMTWHLTHKVEDGIMKHPSDSEEWNSFDDRWTDFSDEARNIRLGLATDGFQPFGNLSSQHSIWPVILIPYNLPPWMCMKQPYFMLSLVIPGPNTPGMDIDVYLQPLIDDLKQLWEEGIVTYDSYRKQNFKMRAALLWTISDYPALADLSGWSTKGKLACHVCYNKTHNRYLKHSKKTVYMGHRRFLRIDDKRRKQKRKFDGKDEFDEAPPLVTGHTILADFSKFTPPAHGKGGPRKRKYDETNSLYNWRKKSIFFELSYWSSLNIRHCIDPMHTEKNVSENIFGTILNQPGKTKDTPQGRMDLLDMRIRPELHLRAQGSSAKYMPNAIFTLNATQREAIFQMLRNLKTPDAYMSNISRCIDVTGKKLSGLKSHDYHILLQQLLPIMIKDFLPHSVAGPLIGLSSYYKSLCAPALKVDDLEKKEKEIIEILVGLEQVFPPSFFTSMVHITMHLAHEAKQAGPVQYRWMYPIERYLRKLKDFVRNKARPAGSIAEAYLADECMTFCSRYLADVETEFNRAPRNEDNSEDKDPEKLGIFKQSIRLKGSPKPLPLTAEQLEQAHYYVLNNCDEIVSLYP